jgi:hypothetical protein
MYESLRNGSGSVLSGDVDKKMAKKEKKWIYIKKNVYLCALNV